jgi:hypothetical protein
MVCRMVSSGVFATPPEAFLDDQVFVGPGLQRVDDLRPPCALDDERAGDARTQPDPPIGELRVGIVGLHHVGEIDDRPSYGAEGVGKSLDIGSGTEAELCMRRLRSRCSRATRAGPTTPMVHLLSEFGVCTTRVRVGQCLPLAGRHSPAVPCCRSSFSHFLPIET